MSITVGSMSALSYDTYMFKNSSAYEENAAGESEVSKEYFNIYSISSAAEASGAASSADFGSISSVASCAASAIGVSQLSIYDTLTADSTDSGIASLLTNDADISELYDSLTALNRLSVYLQFSDADPESESTPENYGAYLDETESEGTVFDVTA